MYYAETIQQQTKYRRTADILAVILKVVIQRGIERGAQSSFSRLKRYLLLSLECGLVTREPHKESIYRITQKGLRFLQTLEQMNEMIQYPRK
jgi:predicted transcriptional regulator